jgi:hypothetical protein
MVNSWSGGRCAGGGPSGIRGRPMLAPLLRCPAQAAFHDADLMGEDGEAGTGRRDRACALEQCQVECLVRVVAACQCSPRRAGHDHVEWPAGSPRVLGDVGADEPGAAGQARRAEVRGARVQGAASRSTPTAARTRPAARRSISRVPDPHVRLANRSDGRTPASRVMAAATHALAAPGKSRTRQGRGDSGRVHKRTSTSQPRAPSVYCAGPEPPRAAPVRR